MNSIQAILEALVSPFDYARNWKAQHRAAVVGTFCSYAPVEIILAAGALPFRLFAASDQICRADSHLQAYCCSLVRGALEDALSGSLDFLDGTVFPHTCDSMARLSDIFRLSCGFTFHLDLVLPVKLNTQSSRDYLVATLADFQHDLEQRLQTTISAKALEHAIAVQNRIRSGLRKLHQLRCENPKVMKGSDLQGITKASMFMDRYQFADLLDALVDIQVDTQVGQTARQKAPSSSGAKRILLAGGFCSMPDFHGMIEEAGGTVVWDDLCTGGRAIEGDMDTGKEPLAAMAEHYARRIVCPAKHSALTDRAENLIRKVRETRADGVIYIYLKFCDPHAFDVPYLKQMLSKAGIPIMALELEDRRAFSGQMQTRCQAFLEMIR
jgi:bcr-type benzoyl-CoA reductase subunit C